MPVADPKGRTRPSVAWRPLTEEAAKRLTEEAACFVWLNLTTGELEVRATDEFAASPPWLVAVCWTLRWPVAPLPADRANKLMDEIAPTLST